MKKLISFIFFLAFVAFCLVVCLIMFKDPIAKHTLEKQAVNMTQTQGGVGDLKTSFDGKVELELFFLGTAKGYKHATSLEAKKITAQCEPTSLFSTTAIISTVNIEELIINYELDKGFTSNFSRIKENIDNYRKENKPGFFSKEVKVKKVTVEKLILNFSAPILLGNKLEIPMKDLVFGDDQKTASYNLKEFLEVLEDEIKNLKPIKRLIK